MRGIAVDAIEFLNFGGIRPIPRLAFFIDVVRKGLDLVDPDDCGQSDASHHGAKQVAAAQRRFPQFVNADPPTEQFLPRLALESSPILVRASGSGPKHNRRARSLQLN